MTKEHSSSAESELIERIEDAGREIHLHKVLHIMSNEVTGVTMLPPCPTSQFIDQFPTDIKNKAKAKAAAQQAQYEGEVKVFHALKRLAKPLFVMHSLKYTHQQYALFVDHHCKRRDTDEEGEADFVAVTSHNDIVAIYEVKAVEFTKESAKKVFGMNYKTAREQLEKTCTLIKGICRKIGSFEPKIYKYTVFTNIDRKYAEGIAKYSKLNEFEKSCIFFKDDLEFNSITSEIGIHRSVDNELGVDVLKHFMKKQSNSPFNIKHQMLCTLIGLWCTNEKNELSEEKWELGKTINRVDNLLRNAAITNKLDAPTSPKVKGSPAVFKELGILCLTEEQKQIFCSEDHRIVINGPAGSGKTVLILGKIIQLARKTEELIIVIVPSSLMADWYEKNLKKSGIGSARRMPNVWTDNNHRKKVVIEVIDDYRHNKLGSVGDMAGFRILKLCAILEIDAHLFLDDFHSFDFAIKFYPHIVLPFVQNDEINDLWQYTLSKLIKTSKKTFWLCYDSLQSTLNTSFDQQKGNIERWESRVIVYKLSANLRNSYETSNFIKFIREERLLNIRNSITLVNCIPNMNVRYHAPFDVEQATGHYIHGPAPKIIWIDLFGRESEKEKAEYLTSRLTNEVSDLLHNKVAIIHDDYGNPLTYYKESGQLKEHAKEFRHRLEQLAAQDFLRLDEICQKVKQTIDSKYCKMDLHVFHMDEVVSAEWPVVMGIIKVFEKCNIALDLEHNEAIESQYKTAKQQFRHEYEAKQDPIDRLLAKMNAILSRGRAYCVLFCVIDEKKSFFEFEKDDYYFCRYGCLNASHFNFLGDGVLDLSLFGESPENPITVHNEPVDITPKQLQGVLHNISLLEVPIRLPSGKLIEPKVFAKTIAASYGFTLNESKELIEGNFTDEQLAIAYRNFRNMTRKFSILESIIMKSYEIFPNVHMSYLEDSKKDIQKQESIERSEMLDLKIELLSLSPKIRYYTWANEFFERFIEGIIKKGKSKLNMKFDFSEDDLSLQNRDH